MPDWSLDGNNSCVKYLKLLKKFNLTTFISTCAEILCLCSSRDTQKVFLACWGFFPGEPWSMTRWCLWLLLQVYSINENWHGMRKQKIKRQQLRPFRSIPAQKALRLSNGNWYYRKNWWTRHCYAISDNNLHIDLAFEHFFWKYPSLGGGMKLMILLKKVIPSPSASKSHLTKFL